MKTIELCSGTKSFSKIAERNGHKVFTIDIDKKSNPDLCIDIMDLEISMIPEEFRNPDFVWFSPPCTQYSHAKRRGVRDIEGANKIVLRGIDLIKELNPKFYVIENPQTGLLKDQGFMKKIPFTDASYCKYGYSYRKQTRFWNNIGLILKTCKKDCNSMIGNRHKGSAGNGRTKYTDRAYSLKDKYSLPPKLCEHILKQLNNALGPKTGMSDE